MLWTGKWPLIVLALVLPVLILPLLNVLLFPEVPITTSILAGVIISLLEAIGLRLIQSAKAFGARFILAIIIISIVVGLLVVLLSKLLS